VDGRVVRGTRDGPRPVAGHWVTLHRVGRDHAGPLDSVRTTASGNYSFRYHVTGDTSAIYFVATSFDGIIYPGAPLHLPVVHGDDALITVFDTTSGPVAIKLGGRHLIIGAPDSAGLRTVGEIYDLVNDSTVTLIARDSVTPVWTARVPPAALDFQLNSSGDIGDGAVSRSGSTIGLFAPLSPGIRQLAFTYRLPARAFPLDVAIQRPVQNLEVLVQEPTARVTGAPVRETAPVTTDGRTLRRFTGRDVDSGVAVHVDVPTLPTGAREKVYLSLGVLIVMAMIGALTVALRRVKRAPRDAVTGAAPRAPESPSEALARAIAELDAAFERAVPASDEARARYEAERASLKQELGAALASQRRAASAR
jgi:hypothetical protein